ncbi:beta-glucosidase BglX [Reichenbachiella ulvae]|uniref:beta-glucosidase n=1 Tax=Reichenbachiella ulvae TaxID=2980104 RepID=A0ABT3D054_9BACT|nr:beta-glucosidase BglX [Reichenbachiella ulvae]MCV9389189.1 beta-glucosidase BglX [Reichenbachiella ulvae]
MRTSKDTRLFIPSTLLFLLIIFIQSCGSTQVEVSEEDRFVNELLSKMTLEEKVGQLHQITSQWNMTGPAPNNEYAKAHEENLKSGRVGSMLNVIGAEATLNAQKLVVENSRLGIPLIFGYDVIHGYQTMFPVPLGEAASWDPGLLELSASIAAVESAAAGLHWTFAPMMDVGRDARWGRVMEGAGEDPYLSSVLSAARVRGFQGEDLSDKNTIAACAKHFAGYAFAESGKDYNTVDVSNSTLHNVILPPFKAATEAGAATYMNSFNIIQGVPATANSYIQRDLLKDKWGFEGFVVSDWNSIGEMIDHGAAQDLKEAASKAFAAGNDMDMEGYAYANHLQQMIESGEADTGYLDEAVSRVLRIKYRLGLFEDPYKYSDTLREKNTLLSPGNRAAALKVARESIVLLKNENSILPLKKDLKSIAVIGPLADDKDAPLGNWRASAISNSAVSLLEGIKAKIGDNTQINYAKGCDLVTSERGFAGEISFNTEDRSGFPEAIAAAKKSEIVLLAIGEDCYQSGEGRSQANIGLRGLQLELFEAVKKANPNVVIVLMNGRPLAIPELDEEATAILETWFLGSESGHAIADVLYGDHNPSGKLPMTFPRSNGQVPIYYNYLSTGRPGPKNEVFWSHYTDETNDPLYPFGYGLSYTTFSYDKITVNPNDNGMIVSAMVTNTGEVQGTEVVQLYIRDLVASLPRPVKELKGFKKVQLIPGESKMVEFTLSEENLGYYDNDGNYVVEPGLFSVMIGGNSRDLIKTNFEWNKAPNL